MKLKNLFILLDVASVAFGLLLVIIVLMGLDALWVVIKQIVGI